MDQFSKRLLAAAATSALASAWAVPTWAAEAAAEVEQLVVTALKGNVSAQEAPVTLNVATGEELQRNVITSLEQLTSALPGVRIQQAPGGTIATMVRGVGSSASSSTFDQSVGLFIDGVHAGHPKEYSAALFDISRLELLKGTQSAVVGKGTSVGALAVVTNKPQFQYGGEVSAFHDFELGSNGATATINVPMSDIAALRVAGTWSDEHGWMHNPLTGHDGPRTDRRAARVSARFTPGNIDWTVYGQLSAHTYSGGIFRYGADPTGVAARVAAARGDPNFRVAPYETRSTPRSGNAANPLINFYGLTTPSGWQNMGRLVSNFAYRTEAFTVTSVTGWSTYTDATLVDVGLPQLARVAGAQEVDEQFSQELRIATNGDGPVSAMGGVYYWHDDWVYVNLSDNTVNAATGGSGNGVGAFTRTYGQVAESTTGFGQVAWSPMEQVRLTAGARYEHYKKTGSWEGVRIINNPPGSTLFLTQNVPFAPFSVTRSDNFFDYSLQAQYFATPDFNIYASYATGTKGFGYQSLPTSGITGNPGYIEPPYFAPERSKSAEVGAKWTLPNGRGRLNAALFTTKIKNFQYAFREASTGIAKIRTDQIRSRGVELDANLRVVDGLTAYVTATYAKVEKTVPVPGAIGGVALAPKWSGIGGVNYERSITPDLNFTAALSFEFRSWQYMNDSATAVVSRDPARVRTGLRLGVEYVPWQTEVALVGRNIGDVHALSYSYASPLGPGAISADEQSRTIALQIRKTF